MRIYAIGVVVRGFDLASEFQHAGLECCGYDALAGITGGVTTVDADVPAATPLDAFMRLRDDLRSLNVTVERIDLDLVTLSSIALRLDVSRETARLWATGKRRAGFPDHYSVAGDVRVWRWSDVYAWAVSQGLDVDEEEPLPADVVDAMNGTLAQHRMAASDGWIIARPSTGSRMPLRQQGFQVRGGWKDAVKVAA